MSLLHSTSHAFQDHEYLVGGRLTLADICVYCRLLLMPYINMKISGQKYPTVARWMTSLWEREAFRNVATQVTENLDKFMSAWSARRSGLIFSSEISHKMVPCRWHGECTRTSLLRFSRSRWRKTLTSSCQHDPSGGAGWYLVLRSTIWWRTHRRYAKCIYTSLLNFSGSSWQRILTSSCQHDPPPRGAGWYLFLRSAIRWRHAGHSCGKCTHTPFLSFIPPRWQRLSTSLCWIDSPAGGQGDNV